MPGLFEIESRDIRQLDALDLTKLLETLVSNELAANGVQLSSAYISFDITIPDGGADGFVTLGGAVPEMPRIPSKRTLFQAKSGTMAADQFVSELFVPRTRQSQLKPHVKTIVEENGTYILFYGKPCPLATQNARIRAMQTAVKALYPRKKPLKIQIFDSSSIAQWTNEYLPAIIRVSKATRRANLQDFTTWQGWREYGTFETSFVGDAEINEYIGRIRSTFTEPRKWLRIVGQSGLGKSRLAFEAFRKPVDGATDIKQRLLSDSMVYVGDATVSTMLSSVRDMRNNGISATIVADNCTTEMHEKLLLEIRH